VINSQMQVAFTVDASAENAENIMNVTLNANSTPAAVSYSFCPTVDQLQAFNLSESATWAAGDIAIQNLTQLSNQSYLRFVGVSNDATLVPTDASWGSALIYDGNVDSKLCSSGKAVASFLVLNITLNNGIYRTTSTFSEPVQVGFQPTCTDDNVCLFDPDLTCIGAAGKKNCATCVHQYSDLVRDQVQVFASYYGTDANGRTLQSGSENPLNFRQLSADAVFAKVRDSITSL
jgi:hypothetical protein